MGAHFRTARPATTGWILTKTGGQIVVVWGFAHGLLPALALALDRRLGIDRAVTPAERATGAVLLGTGSALGLAAAHTMATEGRGTPVPFDAARELVVSGPYRIVRNPMALSAVLQSTGVALLVGSTTARAIPVASAAIWSLVLRPAEERFLAEQFGAQYEQYRRTTRNWVPLSRATRWTAARNTHAARSCHRRARHPTA